MVFTDGSNLRLSSVLFYLFDKLQIIHVSVLILQKTGKALLALMRMAQCSKPDGQLSPISVDGKTRENLLVQQMKCSKALNVTFATIFDLASGTKVTFPATSRE